MKIISPTFELLHPKSAEEGIEALRWIERLARISHRSEDKQTEDSWSRFISAVVLQHGDWSVVEHAVATVIFRVDRGITHELVRHRLFAFTQESTRFVNGRKSYPEGLEFLGPTANRAIEDGPVADHGKGWVEAMNRAEEAYFEMLDAGWPPQAARSVLPNALAATIAVTGNFRNWRHFLLMRTSKETHPDFKRVTIPLLCTFQEYVPLLFQDIAPNERQIDAMRKPR